MRLTLTAVVDRFEDDTAVLLVGPDEIKVDWPLELLPYVYEGAVLSFTIDRDEDEEARRRAKAKGLILKLLRKDENKV